MTITKIDKSLMINVEAEVAIGDGAIKATLVMMACVGVNDDGVYYCDVDFTDIIKTSFMGLEISDYKAYEELRKTMKTLGVDVADLFRKESEKVVTEDLKRIFIDQFKKLT